MRRLVRLATVVAAAVAVTVPVISLWSVAPAAASGAGGIEITPLTDGRPTSSFHVSPPRSGARTRIAFDVRNVSTVPAEARLYAASVSQTGSAYAVGGAGSAPWIRLGPTTVWLAPGEVRRVEAEVSVPRGAKGGAIGAVVEEPAGDTAVVRRVATLVHLEPGGEPVVPRPVVLLLVATVLVGAAAALVVRQARVRG